MAQVINQYSAVLFITALFLVVSLFLFKRKPRMQALFLPGIIIAGSITAWFFLRPVQTPLMEDAGKVQSMIGAGKPVLLEFQSPY